MFSLSRVFRLAELRSKLTRAEEQVTPPGCCDVLLPTRLTEMRLFRQSRQVAGPNTIDFRRTFPGLGKHRPLRHRWLATQSESDWQPEHNFTNPSVSIVIYLELE